ncbi:MAG: precorrin-3B C(17)-methyltransferase [Pyramidobacter sp.]|nr:precorrin-3B C(17)-methyltransferase [Pyramidobacter sp.]
MIYVIGLGPGGKDQMTPRALAALERCDVIIGYKTYIDLIELLFRGKCELVVSPMRGEVERCEDALRRSREGHTVGLISSGDPGVYGMAGIMLELAGPDDNVEIVPGVTAACAAAAMLGAPLMHDFVVISLSDLLTPWELIEKRLEAAAMGDFVICLYNPMSRGRSDNLRKACEILLRHKSPGTAAGWVRNAGREGAEASLTTLGKLKDAELDMFCTVIIGNHATKELHGRLVTPRGYLEKQ